MHTKN